MARFNTALDAINCAIEIQELSRAKFDGNVRIGIHLGDIFIDAEDVYGDGVNVASRLESIADPGGIYISDSIEKAIRGQTEAKAKYLGELRLKNVSYGVRTYAIQGVGLPIPHVKYGNDLSGRFWAEAQRRGLIRVTISYLVVALLLVMVFDKVRDLGMPLPDWSHPLLVAMLVTGFPTALFLAWSYERSPEGFVRTTSVESWRNPYPTARRKPMTGSLVIVALLTATAFLYFYPGFRSPGLGQEQTRFSMDANDIDQSIAILPFRDISPTKDQEWFSDGVMEAILDQMTRIPGLKVTSRTSVMRYRNSDKSIPEIANELQVHYLLEGGVQVIGDQVRITAQVLDHHDQHLWSQQFDRPYSDIFGIQTEIAKRIATILEVTIGSEVGGRMSQIPTRNLEAYSYYLKARSLNHDGAYDPLTSACWSLFEQAIKSDSNFAEAYAFYGLFWYTDLTWVVSDTLDNAAIIDKSYKLLNKALSLDPNSAVAHQGLGALYLWGLLDIEKAADEFRIAQTLKPSDPAMTSVEFLLAIGRFQEALAQSQKQINSDPNNYYLQGNKALSQYFNGHVAEAQETVDNYLEQSNYHPNAIYSATRVFLWSGDYRRVVQLYER